jgi:hypothetical protein
MLSTSERGKSHAVHGLYDSDGYESEGSDVSSPKLSIDDGFENAQASLLHCTRLEAYTVVDDYTAQPSVTSESFQASWQDIRVSSAVGLRTKVRAKAAVDMSPLEARTSYHFVQGSGRAFYTQRS